MIFSVKRMIDSWLDEYKLIGRIWMGTFPDPDDKFSLSLLERTCMTVLVFVRSLSLLRPAIGFKSRLIRSGLSEIYVIAWLVALTVLLWHPINSLPLLGIIVLYRLVDGVNYRLCILFVDRYKKGWGLRSLNRTLILLLLNYFELIIGFAILYLHFGTITNSIGCLLSNPGPALYFSLVTITTLGYGDYTPSSSIGEMLVVSQTILGFLLVVLVIGSFLTGLKVIREIPPDTDIPNKNV